MTCSQWLNKNSNIFGNIGKNFNENLAINYDFSLNSSLDKIEYNSLGFLYSKNNFKTESTIPSIKKG